MAAEAIPAPRRVAWERRTTTPLFVLGIAFIVAYSVLVLAEDLASSWTVALGTVIVVTWAVFIVDLVVRIVLTPRGARGRFLWRHPVDVLSAFLPVFRAFRVLVLVRQVPYLQRRTGAAVRTNLVVTAVCYSVLFIYFISLATLAAERDAPGATITSFGEAMWWAVVTIATVGYGDAYPVTVVGRLYAVMLMMGGVAIVGTASATIISLINERIATVRNERDHEPGTTTADAAPTTDGLREVRPPGRDISAMLAEEGDDPLER